MSQVVNEKAESNPPADRWWIPIATLVALIPILAGYGLVAPPDAFFSLVSAPFTLLGFVLALLSPIFVHLDKRYVESVSAWKPSGWYYFMIFPPLALLSIIYIYQRHKYVGVP